jgi:phage protein D
MPGADAVAAQATAVARFAAAARRFVVVRGESIGTPAMRVGSRVAVHGVGSLFQGPYYVAAVRHRFDGTSGFRTDFTALSPRLPASR